MSTPNRLRRLLRPVLAPRALVPVANCEACAFLSSTAVAHAQSKDVRSMGRNVREGKQMKLGKFKKRESKIDRGRRPEPGERKAVRKQVLLSNSNALPVALGQMTAKNMLEVDSTNQVLEIPALVVDQLRAVNAFKSSQNWRMFRRPSTLIRAETVEVIKQMQEAVDDGKVFRLVVSGDRICGKSVLLLQAMAHAYLNEWIVFHIPEAQELTTACTEYATLPGTEPVQYMQPTYALGLIHALKRANESVLTRLTTNFQHTDIPNVHIPLRSPLLALANAAKEAEGAWVVFQALWHELVARVPGRRPILFVLDGLPHIMRASDYRSPSFEPVHSHDLALVRLFTDCLSGKTKLPNGGAVLAATTRGNAPRTPSMDLALRQREAEQAGEPVPAADPFFRHYDPRVEAALKTVRVLSLAGISKREARAIMEYWAASGVLRATVDERAVSEKWTLGGNGILGEMERAALLTMRL